jgi:hypothetical protein
MKLSSLRDFSVYAYRIQQQLSDLLELYVHAYYAPKSEKYALLVKANIQLEIIRHYFAWATISVYMPLLNTSILRKPSMKSAA